MTNQDTSHFDTVSSSFSHIQYINSIRKDRPLPKIPEIPERRSSMPVPCTKGYGYNNGTKISAQQVFQMLSREPPKEEWVGGVYAFKTEVSTPQNANTSNGEELGHSNFDTIENNMPRSRPVSDVPSLSSGGGGTSSFEIQTTSHQDYDTLNNISQLYTDDDPSLSHSFDHTPLFPSNNSNLTKEDVESYQPTLVSQVVDQTQRPVLQRIRSSSSSSNSISNPGTMTSFSLTHDKESLKTYRRMASKTNNRQVQMTFAKYLLQLVTNHTSGETRDRLQEEAEYWIDRLSKSNHSEALYIKGQWHAGKDEKRKLMGSQYKKKNMSKAFKCFQQAAKFGSVEAHYDLAEYWKERLEYKKAISNYRYAASKNHILALYKLANVLIRGLLNQEKNVQQGLVYLKQAADTNEPESARSAYDLGCIYANDLESIDLQDTSIITAYVTDMSNKNYPKAIHYLCKADELGLPIAAYRLGVIHEKGCLGFKSDRWEAYKYYAKAAEMRNEHAMLELSRLYREGVPGYLNPHPLMAYKWCQRATENGNEVAEFTLG
ncbi:HCP-like protein [Backusella circina FSU 941]|nr:HCP-like protein [Backusella circina FSU 941]